MTDQNPAADQAGSDGDAVIIERTFDAPPAVIWQMWTDPDSFAAWYGPQDATIPAASIDATVGGRRLICMEMQTTGGPMTMWFDGAHVEVVEPSRLAYTEFMADSDGNQLPPEATGMPPGHPAVTTVTVELSDLGGSTRVVVTHAGIPSDSPGAMGWQMALDKLTAHLADR